MKWTIKIKLLAGFLAVTLLTLAMGIFSIMRMSLLNSNTVEIGTNQLPSVERLSSIQLMFNYMRRSQMRFLLEEDAAGRQESQQLFKDAQAKLANAQKEYETVIADSEERKLYDQFTKDFANYLEQHEQFVKAVSTNKPADAKSILLGDGKKLFDRVIEDLETASKYNQDGAEKKIAESAAAYSSARVMTFLALMTLVSISLAIGLWLSIKISKALKRAVEVADQLAKGDLTAEVSSRSSDETGQLLRSMKVMVESLRESVGQIGQGSNQVAINSSQIAAASDQSKHNSQTLAASSEEVTATIHEMAASIRQVSGNAHTQSAAAVETSAAVSQMVSSLHGIAENTKQLADLSASAEGAAKTGQHTLNRAGENMARIGSCVESATRTINELGSRAESIGRIVETIGDIADQTNLLALNAAIEAARAGEHGMGFAVVADEVRKLAERSARSTKEISELIEAIQKESRAAVHQMEESNQTVRDYIADTSVKDALKIIIESVTSIVGRTKEIEASTREQSAGAEQISQASQDLTRLTQEISAAAEEQTTGAEEVARAMESLKGLMQQSVQMADDLQSSAQNLSRQSEMLNGIVGRFNTGQQAERFQVNLEHIGATSALVAGSQLPSVVQRIRTSDMVN